MFMLLKTTIKLVAISVVVAMPLVANAKTGDEVMKLGFGPQIVEPLVIKKEAGRKAEKALSVGDAFDMKAEAPQASKAKGFLALEKPLPKKPVKITASKPGVKPVDQRKMTS